MKFRGKMKEILCIQHFSKIVNTISKMARTAALRLTEDKLYFITREQVGQTSGSLWCELPKDRFFMEYTMSGLSAENNEIFLELTMDYLWKALKSSIQTAKMVKIKLTKKHTPCLTLESELPSMASHSKTVVHDIPVIVLPSRMWKMYEEPEMPEYDVSIYLPPLKTLRNIVDRMKNLSSYVYLSITPEGTLTLKVETDMLVIQTHFKDLQVPAANISQAVNRMPWAEARVDLRKISQFLSGQQINPQNVICNIVNNQVVHLFLLHNDVALQYFLPHLAT